MGGTPSGNRGFPSPARLELFSMQAESLAGKDHIGHRALGCSLASWFLLGIAVWMFIASFCIGRCPSIPPIYGLLLMGSALGLLAANLATLVLSIRALVLHRQPRWAVAALIVMFLPAIVVGALLVANRVAEILS